MSPRIWVQKKEAAAAEAAANDQMNKKVIGHRIEELLLVVGTPLTDARDRLEVGFCEGVAPDI